MNNAFDVTVLGAGPAGALTAMLLSQRGLRVMLLEEQERFSFKVGETLPGEAKLLLAQTQLLHAFQSIPKIVSAGNRSLWGSNRLSSRASMINPYGSGWHLDRVAFDQMLRHRANDSGVVSQLGVRIGACNRQNDLWKMSFSCQGQSGEISCRWVVDATGRRAAFARRHGARRLILDRLVGIIATLRVDGDSDCTTLVEAGEHGWWYSALVPGGSRIFIHFTDGDARHQSSLRSAERWSQLASESELIGPLLRNAHRPSDVSRAILLSDTSRLDRAAGNGWVAVGDAASAVDPLSSMGLMHAMTTALRVGNTLMNTSFCDTTLGEYADFILREHNTMNDLRIRYYHMEQRWRTASFWRRRHETHSIL